MRRLIRRLVLSGALALAGCSITATDEDGMAREERADVREPSEWRTASVQPGDFTLLNMSMGTVPARLQELDPRTPIACLCHHGGRSMQVAQFLVNQGFAQVANIAGGIDAWAVELDGSIPRY